MSKQSNYERQRQESDATFIQGVPLIFDGLGLDINNPDLGCQISTIFQDTKKGTDLVITNNKNDDILKMVAYRMRTFSYIERYPLDITFRFANINNIPTEWIKIMQGVADVGFYGFTDEHGKIVRWILISFDGLRSVHHFDEETGIYVPDSHIRTFPGKNTGKGDTSFLAYRATDFLAHDNSPLTTAEDKIILGHSLGYFDDIMEVHAARKGLPSSFIMKDKIDRIDGRV